MAFKTDYSRVQGLGSAGDGVHHWWMQRLTAVALVIPVVFMAVALHMLVGSFARSVKEASTYASFIAIAGFMPSLFLSVLPIRPQPWMKLIPTVGQLYFINDVARGLPLDWIQVLLASGITLGIGIDDGDIIHLACQNGARRCHAAVRSGADLAGGDAGLVNK